MDAFIAKAKDIDNIEDATLFLYEYISPKSDIVSRALNLALKAHDGQVRKSGEPYIVHPILVGAITASMSGDEMMVAAALLHDVVEDTEYTLGDMYDDFGEDVAHMIDGLTKIIEIDVKSDLSSVSNDRLINSALTFRKMLIASIKDVRILVIKLCDRFHNMLTLDALSPEKQKRIAEETLVVYAPIAHRLGISRLKNYLEDLSFYYIYPDDWNEIENYLKSNNQSLEFKLNDFINRINSVMLSHGFHPDSFEILGRVKHNYSIYLKMHRKGVTIDEVLDLLAVRVIVKEPIDCYSVLGLLHIEFKPLISRFKDYIALPKENGYQTIHSTIFNEDGIVEAQIRTIEMHKLAEYGIAAHWKYKSGNDKVNLEWLESLNYQKESIEEFYALAKCDLFSEDIAVYTPKGDYFTLPKGSVALDFAYAIHSEVGALASGALINNHKSSLLSTLKNGDIVDIIKDKENRMHCSWIDAVVTSKAKDGISNGCKHRLKESNEKSAYNILSTLLDYRRDGIEDVIEDLNYTHSLHKLPNHLDYYKEVIHRMAYYLGKKQVRFWELMKKGYKKPNLREIEHFRFYTNKPFDIIEFDYCCHPKVGDEIVAFYETNKVVIHHKLCKKAYQKILDKTPMLFVEWKTSRLSHYRLIISLQNKRGALADLLNKLSALNLNVTSIELGIKSSDSAEYCQIEAESSESKKSLLKEKIAQKFKLIDIISLDDAYNK
ncbi:GTP pyrophosphokinase, (p)ppGpp synthetase II / Guanosine-3',5'-bis(diphosphate) 3'-pyrophosphohydrolase [hydrothermal vent metagenome]|uniref:GTP pyrophosphokinase, (P)ppGpp synthetase II / Guanosine-3',5'-bis(Diphosphate) 3'-pyrophosphohydrolase n=1 Tax=hydrothermal vent metagenome TaxID=652676 RepID=A0A1W1BZK7_9ZZZZ